MIEILKITQIILSLFLIFVILIQPKKSSLSLTSFGNEGGKFEKRGSEKVLHNTTIILTVLFIVNALLYFFMA